MKSENLIPQSLDPIILGSQNDYEEYVDEHIEDIDSSKWKKFAPNKSDRKLIQKALKAK